MTELLIALFVVTVTARSLRFRSFRRHAGGPSVAPSRDEQDALAQERARTEEMLNAIDNGVVLFSDALFPVLANRTARRMLGVRGESLPPRLASDGLLSVARRAVAEGLEAEDTVTLWPGRRRLEVRATPLQRGGALVQLRDVTEELRMQQMRRQFVANASHELKSPVASLHALAEALREAVPDDLAAAERFADRLVQEAERLARLIADLLDLSRVEDPVQIANSAVDLGDVARRSLQEVEAAAAEKQLHVKGDLQGGAWVRGDGQQLGLLARNLLDNAVRYTNDGGTIRMDVSRDGNEVVVRVSDDGIGIPLQALTRVFERFYRVDKDRSRSHGGTGLGLAIVKHVAELHGGHVSLRSELGEGSTFTARFPALENPEDAVEPAPLTGEIVREA